MSAVPSVMQGATTTYTSGLYYRLYTDYTAMVINEDRNGNTVDYSKLGPDLIIPESLQVDRTIFIVSAIEEFAFSTAKNITSVVIPEFMQTIQDFAFSECTSLTSIVWNARNCTIDSWTFDNSLSSVSAQITNVTFGEMVERIPNSLCKKMSKLTSITIPNSVISIGSSAFRGCSSLKSLTFATNDMVSTNGKDTVFFLNTNGWDKVYVFAWSNSGSNAEWPGVPAQKLQYTYLGYDVYYFVADKGNFNNCIFNNTGYGAGNQTDDLVWTSGMCYNNGNWISIEKHDLEAKASVEIGASAFEDCVGLTAISIPECVKTIGESAFQNCSNIETITIGSNVTDIGESAFSGCQSVYEITCKATKAPNVYESTFENVSTLATLYVPAESVQKYKIHAVWSRFFNIEPIEESEEAIDSANQDGASVNQKIICNGQVLIVRDGEIYSILGEKIE